MIEEKLIDSLTSHPINERIYGDLYDHELIKSIQDYGFKGTIEITKDNVIISGHRRYNACVELGFETIPVTILDIEDPDEIINYLIRMNQSQRKRTNEQIAAEFDVLKEIAGRRAAQRQVEAGGDKKSNEYKKSVVDTWPQPVKPADSNGKARDEAAAKTKSGWSGKKAEAALKVKKYADKIKPENPEVASKLLDTLNNKSVNAAAKELKKIEKQQVKADKEKQQSKEISQIISTPKPAPVKKSKFNTTNENIEWAKWSWNPVTGCLHNCQYCYARDLAVRYNDGDFSPAFHEGRLNAPQYTNIPKPRLDEPGINNVFVCSMADLFGKWVDPTWIQTVIDICREQSQWTYLMLTKNPERYLEFEFPDNCWLGASATNQQQFDMAIKTFGMLKIKCVKFLSCEPLNEQITVSKPISCIDWMIIGGRSKSMRMPAFQPEWAWVQHLIVACDNANVPIYFKPNLTVRPKFYPKKVK